MAKRDSTSGAIGSASHSLKLFVQRDAVVRPPSLGVIAQRSVPLAYSDPEIVCRRERRILPFRASEARRVALHQVQKFPVDLIHSRGISNINRGERYLLVVGASLL
jgi:hypothetical protein